MFDLPPRKVSEAVLRDLYASETGVLPVQDNQPFSSAGRVPMRRAALKLVAPPRVG